MSEIKIYPQELRQTSDQLRVTAKKIDAALQAIDQDILSLKGDTFLGNRANAVQAHYAPKREALLKAKNTVEHFSEDLISIADRFERADRSDGGLHPISGSGASSNPQPPPPSSGTGSSSNNTADVKKVKDAIAALNVTKNPKYQPKNGNTYCNIFAMDFCKKMGAPFPEWLDWNKDGKIDDYLNANEAISWLDGSYNAKKGVKVETGAQLGWKIISANEAAQYASEGKVVLAGWTNPVASDPGHLAVVRPESTAGNIQIAQAGGSNFDKGAVTQGFGNRPVTYFVFEP